MRLSSATKPSRLSNTFSVTIAVPSAVASSATASGMKSVANPGNGNVATSTARHALVGAHLEAVGGRRDLQPHLAELHHHGLDVVDARTEQRGVATGDADGHEQRAGLDAVGHDLAHDRLELLDALDHQRGRARAVDLGAHAVEHVGEVGDLGLAGRVLDHGLALGQDRGGEQVLGGADAREVEHHARTGEPVGAGLDEAVHHVELDAHRLEPTEVHVELAVADVVAAGHRDAAPGRSAPATDRAR